MKAVDLFPFPVVRIKHVDIVKVLGFSAAQIVMKTAKYHQMALYHDHAVTGPG